MDHAFTYYLRREAKLEKRRTLPTEALEVELEEDQPLSELV